jgi:predicted DNA-binding transcriptional regulator AlpA
MDAITERLLTRKEAADFLGIKAGTLAVWKSTKRYHIPIVKIGRLVRYRISDLINFIDNHSFNQNKS